MAVTIKVAIYDVLRCGYYKRGAWAAPHFGTISSVLSELKHWVSGQLMRNTQTFTPAEDEDVLPVYCFDIETSPNSTDVLLTTWNAVPMAQGGVAAASGDATVGDVDVTVSSVDDGHIAGFPTYFLFMPDEGVVLTIRPEGQSHNGHKGMLRYLQSFMTYCSPCAVVDQEIEDLDAQVIGYQGPDDDEAQQLQPIFSSRLKRVPGKVEFLRGQRERIRKLIRRDTLQTVVQADRDLIGKLLVNVGLVSATLPNNRVKLGYDIDFSPTESELESIITAADADYTDNCDVGFVLRGEQETMWLSHSFLKEEFEVPVHPGVADVLPAAALLAALSNRRTHIVAMLSNGAGVTE